MGGQQIPPHNAYAQAAARQPQTAVSYKQPPAPEVYHLADAANASIPPEIRAQFHCDDQGRVLFFTSPPIDQGSGPVSTLRSQASNTEGAPGKDAGPPLAHSARYLAARARRDRDRGEKRKRDAEDAAAYAASRAKQRVQMEREFAEEVHQLTGRAVRALEDGLAVAARREWESACPPDEQGGEGKWKEEMEKDLDRVARGQQEAWRRRVEVRGKTGGAT